MPSRLSTRVHPQDLAHIPAEFPMLERAVMVGSRRYAGRCFRCGACTAAPLASGRSCWSSCNGGACLTITRPPAAPNFMLHPTLPAVRLHALLRASTATTSHCRSHLQICWVLLKECRQALGVEQLVLQLFCLCLCKGIGNEDGCVGGRSRGRVFGKHLGGQISGVTGQQHTLKKCTEDTQRHPSPPL